MARALTPGEKVDAMLILEGGQGVGKSSALRVLTGESWFGDALPDMGSKDAATYLRGKWIVEIAELTAVRRADLEQVKAFLTRQEERYRPPYGRTEVFEPRRCVFAGTTNSSDYLRDETGNRRFWPVRVGTIDLDAIEDNRDQLWAEAVVAYQSGENWWLEGEAENQSVIAQSERQEDDAWVSIVSDFAAGKSEVACRQVLNEALIILPADMARAHTQRVSKILVQLGFLRDGKFKGGEYKGCVKFVKPEFVAPPPMPRTRRGEKSGDK